MCGETASPTDRYTAKHTKDRFKETGIATNRQIDKQRKTGRAADTAGRWRSLRAPGQPCDEDSGECN